MKITTKTEITAKFTPEEFKNLKQLIGVMSVKTIKELFPNMDDIKTQELYNFACLLCKS